MNILIRLRTGNAAAGWMFPWLALLLLTAATKAYTSPQEGINLHSFREGDDVKLKVNKLTSISEMYDHDYYQFPFCQPQEGPRLHNQNLGEFLAGDRISSSPYILKMKKDMYCEQLCISNLGRGESPKLTANKMVRLIRANYHNNWIVDNLSAASKLENSYLITTRYWQGFPVGFIGEEDQKAYIYNHVNIELFYHQATDGVTPGDAPVYRIVRFIVEPFSIKHDFDPIVEREEELTKDQGNYLPFLAEITNPIASCDLSTPYENRLHTNYKLMMEEGRYPQHASGKVLFTYDVIWIEDPSTPWSSRWDIYLTMNGAVPDRVDWFSIITSLVVVCGIGLCFTSTLLRHLRRDVTGYSELASDEESENTSTGGQDSTANWIGVCAHVFRPPQAQSELLAVACGTGAQLLSATLATTFLCFLGKISPANRGTGLMGFVLFFVLNGATNGYVTARFYATFQGKECHHATGLATVLFPSVAFAIFLVVNFIAWMEGSSDQVPFATFMVLVVLWFFLCTPLVFLGGHFGYKAGPLAQVPELSIAPHPIPDQPWFLSLPCVILLGGLLPFSSIYVESFYMLASAWQEYYYSSYGFFILTFLIMILAAVEMTVLFIYLQLRRENYEWWWRSFCIAASAALWFFLYSSCYYRRLQATSFGAFIFYFGYTGVISLGFGCMMGFVGVASALCFNRILVSFVRSKLGSDVFPHSDEVCGKETQLMAYQPLPGEED